MKKYFKLLYLILLTALILPFGVRAIGEGGAGEALYLTLPSAPEIGQAPTIFAGHEGITVLSDRWINVTEHREMLNNETFAADKEYAYIVNYINNTNLTEYWFADIQENSSYCIGNNIYDPPTTLYPNEKMAIVRFYMGDFNDMPAPTEDDYYYIDIDTPELGEQAPLARNNSKYTIVSQSWKNITDNRDMTSSDVFEEDKYYVYTINVQSYYVAPHSIDSLFDSEYCKGLRFTGEIPYSETINGYFYFGDDESNLVINTGDVVINQSNPPVAGETLSMPNVTVADTVISHGEWSVKDGEYFNYLSELPEVEVGKVYRYVLNLEPLFGYHFADDFKVIDNNKNINWIRSDYSTYDYNDTFTYESLFSPLPEGTSMAIYGDELIWPGYTTTVSVYPVNDANANITWSSSNQNIATVDQDGIVEGIAPGNVTITATNSLNESTTFDITVGIPIESIEVQTNEITMYPGDSQPLRYAVEPENATYQEVQWQPDMPNDEDGDDYNPYAAWVNDEGVLYASEIGTVRIIGQSPDPEQASATVLVHVVARPIESMEFAEGDSITRYVDTTSDLPLNVTPANATITGITYESSDPTVAIVNEDGEIVTKALGTTTITATAPSGATATCTVTVIEDDPVEITSITLDKTEMTLVVGESDFLGFTYEPSEAAIFASYTSSNPSVATADPSGEIVAVSPGTAIVTVSSGNVSATCTVTVVPQLTGIELNKATLTLTEGESETLVVSPIPSGANVPPAVWTSSDPSVFTADETGLIVANHPGTATLTVSVGNNISTTCTVTVLSSEVQATGITLNKTTLTLEEGDIETLVATVIPANATNKTVTWTSNDPSIASVDSNGLVTAREDGTATIIARTNNGFTATCEVTVLDYISVRDIELNKTAITLEVNETETLVATITPDDATDQTIRWSSSNENVATVEDGTVTAVGAGTATITVTSINGLEATCQVTVPEPYIEVEGITLSETELDLEEGETATLSATITPSNATNKAVEWTSSNENVATVEDGVVTAVSAGTVIITATTVNGLEATCQVTVSEAYVAVEEITLNKTTLTLEEGATETLTATITPSNATDKEVRWTSSNEDVVTVANGLVTAINEGTATITATASNGLEAICEVTVFEPVIEVTGISLNKNSLTLRTDENEYLVATLTPSNATDKTVTWTTSNEEVAAVNSNGRVIAVAEGTAIITARTSNGLEATCTVTVSDTIVVTKIKLNKEETTLTEGESETLTATLTPSNATDKTVTWTSNHPEIATVDNAGKITAVKAGTTMIIAQASSGKKATCFVTVKPEESEEPTSEVTFPDVSKNSWYYETIKTAYNKGIIAGYASGKFGPNDKITRGQLVTLLWRLDGSPSSMSYSNKFSDVNESQYYGAAVKWAAAKDIVHGYNATKFGPNNPIIRQDLAVIINNYARYKGLESTGDKDLSEFADCSKVKGNYSEPALKWAVQYKVMSGKNIKNKKYLEPGSNTTRAEAAAMIVNFVNAFDI
ncbi:MAG: Ig-like domain-containing protein [Bacilli bacterium]|nr:Ig-like domain-containing protein [Bacilli bacterium]